MKKKIAFVVSRLQQSGPIIVVEDIIRGMDVSEWEVLIVSLRPEDSSISTQNHFECMGCRCVSLQFSMITLELRTKKVSRKLLNVLQAEDIQIVHSHGYHADLVSVLLPSSIQRITTLHNISGEDFIYSKGQIVGRYMYRRHLNALPKMSCLVAISDHIRNYYNTKLTKHHNLIRIYNGVNTDRFVPPSIEERTQAKAILGLSPSDTVFTYSGSLSVRKDPLLLIDAFCSLRKDGLLGADTRLLLVGQGPLYDECRKHIPEQLSKHVIMPGFCSDVVPYISAADIALTASQSEGFGLNVVEAAAMGLPVIATDIAPHREILGKYLVTESLLFRVGSLKGIMQSMKKAYETHKSWSMSEIAVDIRKRFSGANMSRAYQKAYLENE